VGLHDLYTSLNIVRAMKSRKMRWAGRVASMGEMVQYFNLKTGRDEQLE
jgi:hypothetical protein